jgi:type II secretory pathway component PulF
MRLSAAEAAELGEQIAGLARANLPLAPGLRALGDEMGTGGLVSVLDALGDKLSGNRLRRMLGALADDLEQGASLDDALAARGRNFPRHLRGLIAAGRRTGRLGLVLGRFAGYFRIGAEIRRGLWLNLARPLAALAFACGLLVFILTFVVVLGFDEVFRDFGIAMPLASRALAGLSTGLRTSGPWLLDALAAAGVVAGVVLLAIGPAGRRGVLGRLPLLGPVWRWASLAEFCHLLGLLLESELPLAEAVPMAAEGVPDARLQAAVWHVTIDLDEGSGLAAAIARRPIFPEGLAPILAWAEQHQSLAGALHMLGEMFEARARAQASLATTVLRVLAVLVILGSILLVVFGVVAPIIDMIHKLAG